MQSSGLTLGKNKPPLLMERIDLVEVWRPYLIARGLEEWIEKDMIAQHFQAEAGGAKVELVEVLERGREAKISFNNPQGSTDLAFHGVKVCFCCLQLLWGFSRALNSLDSPLSWR